MGCGRLQGGNVSALRIYGIARTRAFRALWIAEEVGLDYEHLPIEIGDAGARAPEFLRLNPNGRLPFIDDNGFVLFESLAITFYLAKKHSDRKLYPGTLESEARAWQWSFWGMTEVERPVLTAMFHRALLPEDKRDADYATAKAKCDKLAGDAKDRCVTDAKARYGK
jgi:glutathione S-transferase